MNELAKLSFDMSNILGSSTQQPSQFAHTKDCLIYLAGAHVVFYSPLFDEQMTYLRHSTSNINCIVVSPNSSLIAVA